MTTPVLDLRPLQQPADAVQNTRPTAHEPQIEWRDAGVGVVSLQEMGSDAVLK